MELSNNAVGFDIRWFLKQVVVDKTNMVVILNSDEVFDYFSKDYKKKGKFLDITEKSESCRPSEVYYYELLLGFILSKIFGYYYDAMLPARTSIVVFGANRDLIFL